MMSSPNLIDHFRISMSRAAFNELIMKRLSPGYGNPNVFPKSNSLLGFC
jgi:hypothetical protein